MTDGVLADVLMAEEAIIAGQRHAHRPGDLRIVLAVAGNAERGVELGEAVGIARVGEFLRRMRVVGELELGAVAGDAGLLHRGLAAERLVAGVAGKLNLMMAARGRPDQELRA